MADPEISDPSPTPKIGKPRGIAGISPERRREIARLGGQAAAASGALLAHQFEPKSERAKAAGKAGGLAAHANGNAYQFTPETSKRALEARLAKLNAEPTTP